MGETATVRGEAGLRVRLLGGLDIEGVDLTRLGSRKARLFVKRLAVARGAPVSTDALVDVLWPDGDAPARPAEQVSVLASRTRAALGAERLTRTDAGYVLHVAWLDVDAVVDLAEQAHSRLTSGAVTAARMAADAALALIRGPLLPEDAEVPWLEADRLAVARTEGELRLAAAEAALASGDTWAATDAAGRALAADPYDEAALRLLLRGLAATGRPAVALATYARATARLREDLGVDPAAETQSVYLTILRGGAPAAASVPSAPAAVDLAGRADALAELAEAYTVARGGTAQLVLVEGEGGIGKTTLLDTWLRALPVHDAHVLRGSGDEVRSALPLQPVLDALSRHLRSRSPDEVERLLAGDAGVVGALLGVHNADGSRLPMSLASLAGATTDAVVLFAALSGVLARLLAERMVVLVVDDGHVADRSTAAFLAQSLARDPQSPLLLVVARRPGEGPAYAGVTRTVTLGRLDPAAVAAVVGEARADELYARSGGHPLFLTELAQAAPGELPTTVRAAVEQRCARTGAAADTIVAAAVLGMEVDLELLAAALRSPEGAVLAHLEVGVQHKLLVEAGSGFAFAHAIVREALRAGVLAGRRAMLHREAARAVADRPRRDPLVVAYHASEGGDDALAARALSEAALVAADRYDNDEALRLGDLAVTLDPAPDILLTRARLRVRAERYTEAAADASSALAAGAGAEGFEVAALAAYMQRDFGLAERFAREGARLAETTDVRSSCWALAGRVAHATGRLNESGEYYARARTEAPPTVTLVVDAWESLLLAHQGQLTRAHDLCSGVSHDANRLPFVAPHRLLTQALVLGDMGRVLEAMAVVDQLKSVVEREHLSRYAGRADNVRAWLLRGVGVTDAADELNAAAVEQARRVSAGEALANAHLDLAEGALRAGRLDDAARHLDLSAGPFAPHPMQWRHGQRHRLLSARLLLATGDAAAAEDAARDVAMEVHALDTAKYAAAADLVVARARRVQGLEVELEGVDAAVRRLDAVGAITGWWAAADVAREFAVTAWADLAANRVRQLLPAAGPYTERLRAAADGVLAGSG